jgi:hypothetical protein
MRCSWVRVVSLVGIVAACVLAMSDVAWAATDMVTNTSDSDPGSLRDVIASAGSGDAIKFAAGVTGTITLTSGELLIDKDLTIIGPGARMLSISGNGTSRVFFVDPGASGATGPPASGPTVRISDLRVADGNATGGSGGAGDTCGGGGGGGAGMGGGLFINGGTVTLANVALTDNHAVGGAGGPGVGFGSCGTVAGGGGGVGGPGGSPTAGNGGALGGVSGGQEGAGGSGATNCSAGQDGGFGGGGGGQFCGSTGYAGGFGGGGGGGGIFSGPGAPGGSFGGQGAPGNSANVAGGGGGGLGGAIFVRLGALHLVGDTFRANTAAGGTGASPGQGKGGALFVSSGATLSGRCAAFSRNSATDAAGSGSDTNDVYGAVFRGCTALRLSAPASGTVGTSISARSISGMLSAEGPSPTGTVTFKVLGPSAAPPSSCASGGRTDGTASVSGNRRYHPSSSFTPPAAGDYWWYASYSGDTNNNPASSKCGGSMAKTVVAPELIVGHASVSATTASVPLACHGATGIGCDATLTLKTTNPADTLRVVTVGRADATLANAESRTVKVDLNRTGRRLLQSRGRLQTKLIITESGHAIAHRVLTFQPT